MASPEEDYEQVLGRATIYIAAQCLLWLSTKIDGPKQLNGDKQWTQVISEQYRSLLEFRELGRDYDSLSNFRVLGRDYDCLSNFRVLGRDHENSVMCIYNTNDYVYLIKYYTDGTDRIECARTEHKNIQTY